MSNTDEYVYTYKDAEELCRKAFDAGIDYADTCAHYSCNAVALDWEHWSERNKHLFMPSPTVEDVLREFADEVQRCCDTEDTISEYAVKLRLAGEDE